MSKDNFCCKISLIMWLVRFVNILLQVTRLRVTVRSSTTTTQGKPRYLIFRDSRHSLYFRVRFLLFLPFFIFFYVYYQDYDFIEKISPRGDYIKNNKKCTNSRVTVAFSVNLCASQGEKIWFHKLERNLHREVNLFLRDELTPNNNDEMCTLYQGPVYIVIVFH